MKGSTEAGHGRFTRAKPDIETVCGRVIECNLESWTLGDLGQFGICNSTWNTEMNLMENCKRQHDNNKPLVSSFRSHRKLGETIRRQWVVS
jgi:hypothetical protein